MKQEESSHRKHKSPVFFKLQKATTMHLDERGISVVVNGQKNGQRCQKIQKATQCNNNMRNFASKRSQEQKQSEQASNNKTQKKIENFFQSSAKSNILGVQRFNEYEIKHPPNLTEIIINSKQNSQKGQSKHIQSKCPIKNVTFSLAEESYLPTSSSSTQNLDAKQKSHQQIMTQYYTSNKQLSTVTQEGRQQHSCTQFPSRLKSLNFIRTKSKTKQSSLEKHIKSQAKTQKSIDSIKRIQSTIQPSVKRKIIKVKVKRSIPVEDLNLNLSSQIRENTIDRNDIIQKIELHLQLLNQLPTYIKQFKQIYEETECWQDLIFLTYKKFYIERLKVQFALNDKPIHSQYKHLISVNPFRFSFCQIDSKQLHTFKNSLQALKLQTRLQQQNKNILAALRNLYNLFIEKSGKHVNLYLTDNFSEEIYTLMCEQVKLLQQNESDSLENLRMQRINKITKCCLIVGCLNGIHVNMGSVFAADDCSQELRKQFQKFIQILNK